MAAGPSDMARSRDSASWCFPQRVAYVVDHSFPYSSDGYAVRTHEVARALQAAGHEMLVVNRPGRPWDIEGFDSERTVATEQAIDGVRYVFLPGRHTPGMNRRARLRQAEKGLMEAFEIYRPGLVMAVSNWENAEPAQYAARRWNAPFFYEQRGFWEMTRAATEPGYQETEDYARNRDNELRIAQGAEAVFTLNHAMRQELVRRGVPEARIHLVPNGVSDPGPIPKGITRQTLGSRARYLLGYVGSLSAYEGCFDLLPLLRRLRGRGIDVDLAIVGSSAPKGLIGSGHETEAERQLAAEARAEGLEAHVHFVPQVPQDRIGAYYSLLDAMVMPRRRTVVTELVAPLKPYAAAAYGVPVFMTDMPPLDEIARDIDARLFPEGDVETLADMLAETFLDGHHMKMPAKPRAAVHWTRRVAPMSRLLTAAGRGHPAMAEMLQLGPVTGRPAAALPGEGFDTRSLPRIALGADRRQMRVVAVGPVAALEGADVTRSTRAELLSDLASGVPGRFVIDWAGLQDAPGEWDGLWSTDAMRLNRQIMDACRIARDRGWRVEVLGPVRRSRAPLFRTVSGVVTEIRPGDEGTADGTSATPGEGADPATAAPTEGGRR